MAGRSSWRVDNDNMVPGAYRRVRNKESSSRCDQLVASQASRSAAPWPGAHASAPAHPRRATGAQHRLQHQLPITDGYRDLMGKRGRCNEGPRGCCICITLSTQEALATNRRLLASARRPLRGE